MQVIPDQKGFAIYSHLERKGKLPFRVIGSYYHNNPAIDPVPVIKALAPRVPVRTRAPRC